MRAERMVGSGYMADCKMGVGRVGPMGLNYLHMHKVTVWCYDKGNVKGGTRQKLAFIFAHTPS
jgi:hypothetical protein